MKKIFIGALTLLLTVTAFAQKFTVSVDKDDAVYKCGEKATFTVTALDEQGNLLKSGTANIYLREERASLVGEHVMDFSKQNPANFTATLDNPGFVWLTINNPDNDYDSRGKSLTAVGFEPEKIQPYTPNVADFDKFWADGIARVQEIPLDPQIVPAPEFNDAEFDTYRISFANIDNTRIYGFMAVPKGKTRPLPVVVSVPGAGAGSIYPDTYFFRHPELITIIMNVHAYEPKNKEYIQQALKDSLKGTGAIAYAYVNAEDKEKYFYRRAILGINRVFEFLEQRKDLWDQENLGVWGSSQGGMFAIILSGLNPDKVDFAGSNVPAMAEHYAVLNNRTPGWPRLLENSKEGGKEVAPYFDIVNFARRITSPIYVGVGFIDIACVPSSVYAAFNVIPAEDKKMFAAPKMGHSFDAEFVRAMQHRMYKELGLDVTQAQRLR